MGAGCYYGGKLDVELIHALEFGRPGVCHFYLNTVNGGEHARADVAAAVSRVHAQTGSPYCNEVGRSVGLLGVERGLGEGQRVQRRRRAAAARVQGEDGGRDRLYLHEAYRDKVK